MKKVNKAYMYKHVNKKDILLKSYTTLLVLGVKLNSDTVCRAPVCFHSDCKTDKRKITTSRGGYEKPFISDNRSGRIPLPECFHRTT